jgi:hypothetical protein
MPASSPSNPHRVDAEQQHHLPNGTRASSERVRKETKQKEQVPDDQVRFHQRAAKVKIEPGPRHSQPFARAASQAAEAVHRTSNVTARRTQSGLSTEREVAEAYNMRSIPHSMKAFEKHIQAVRERIQNPRVTREVFQRESENLKRRLLGDGCPAAELAVNSVSFKEGILCYARAIREETDTIAALAARPDGRTPGVAAGDALQAARLFPGPTITTGQTQTRRRSWMEMEEAAGSTTAGFAKKEAAAPPSPISKDEMERMVDWYILD